MRKEPSGNAAFRAWVRSRIKIVFSFGGGVKRGEFGTVVSRIRYGAVGLTLGFVVTLSY